MTKKTPQQRIAELDEKKARVEEKLKSERASITQAKRREQAKILNQRRKDETRKKILIGAAVQQLVEQGRWENVQVQRMMSSFLDKDQDRVLFDLPGKKTERI